MQRLMMRVCFTAMLCSGALHAQSRPAKVPTLPELQKMEARFAPMRPISW